MKAGDGLPGLRSTRQRTAVADLLAKVDGFRSAQELHDLLRHDGASVGLTTVYRHLQALADEHESTVDRVAHRTAGALARPESLHDESLAAAPDFCRAERIRE